MTEPKISALGQKLIEILTDAGDKWLARRDLATALQRPSFLQPHDLRVLSDLEAAGLIEVRKVAKGAVKFEFQYRVKQQEGV